MDPTSRSIAIQQLGLVTELAANFKDKNCDDIKAVVTSLRAVIEQGYMSHAPDAEQSSLKRKVKYINLCVKRSKLISDADKSELKAQIAPVLGKLKTQKNPRQRAQSAIPHEIAALVNREEALILALHKSGHVKLTFEDGRNMFDFSPEIKPFGTGKFMREVINCVAIMKYHGKEVAPTENAGIDHIATSIVNAAQMSFDDITNTLRFGELRHVWPHLTHAEQKATKCMISYLHETIKESTRFADAEKSELLSATDEFHSSSIVTCELEALGDLDWGYIISLHQHGHIEYRESDSSFRFSDQIAPFVTDEFFSLVLMHISDFMKPHCKVRTFDVSRSPRLSRNPFEIVARHCPGLFPELCRETGEGESDHTLIVGEKEEKIPVRRSFLYATSRFFRETWDDFGHTMPETKLKDFEPSDVGLCLNAMLGKYDVAQVKEIDPILSLVEIANKLQVDFLVQNGDEHLMEVVRERLEKSKRQNRDELLKELREINNKFKVPFADNVLPQTSGLVDTYTIELLVAIYQEKIAVEKSDDQVSLPRQLSVLRELFVTFKGESLLSRVSLDKWLDSCQIRIENQGLLLQEYSDLLEVCYQNNPRDVDLLFAIGKRFRLSAHPDQQRLAQEALEKVIQWRSSPKRSYAVFALAEFHMVHAATEKEGCEKAKNLLRDFIENASAECMAYLFLAHLERKHSQLARLATATALPADRISDPATSDESRGEDPAPLGTQPSMDPGVIAAKKILASCPPENVGDNRAYFEFYSLYLKKLNLETLTPEEITRVDPQDHLLALRERNEHPGWEGVELLDNLKFSSERLLGRLWHMFITNRFALPAVGSEDFRKLQELFRQKRAFLSFAIPFGSSLLQEVLDDLPAEVREFFRLHFCDA